MSHYVSADSPRNSNEVEQFNRSMRETTRAVQDMHQITKTMQQKMALFQTAQDSRGNHQQLKELAEKGNKWAGKITRRLQDLTAACRGANGRARKTQVNKLSNDYKNVLRAFEEACQRMVESETEAIAHIRRTSSSFRQDDSALASPLQLGYNEDQIYTQAQLTTYNEDDLMRREEDIIQINDQLRQVNAAFREVDDLIAQQGETIVEVEQITGEVKDNVEGALHQVQQADERRGYCQCSKTKMLCYGGLAILIAIVVLALVMGLKK